MKIRQCLLLFCLILVAWTASSRGLDINETEAQPIGEQKGEQDGTNNEDPELDSKKETQEETKEEERLQNEETPDEKEKTEEKQVENSNDEEQTENKTKETEEESKQDEENSQTEEKKEEEAPLVDLEYETASLFGNSESLAYYYTILLMGNPPQEQAVIVDTGSGVLNVACSNCDENYCGHHQDEHFIIEDSDTFYAPNCYEMSKCPSCKNGQCRYSVHYSEGSVIEGVYVQDEIRFDTNVNNSDGFTTNFVCNTKETNMIKSQKADGILGLNNGSSIIEDAYMDNHNIDHDMFSLCIGLHGGFMNIGSAGNSEEEIKWVPSSGHQYYLTLDQVTINGKVQQITAKSGSGGKPFLDSGTTDVYLPASIYDFLLSELKEFCQVEENCSGEQVTSHSDTCWKRPETLQKDDFFSRFPKISFTFSGQEIEWHPREYLSGYSEGIRPADPEEADYYHCLSIQKLSRPILGAPFMKNYNIVFDKAASRVGFQRANCVAPISEEEHQKTLEKILKKRHRTPKTTDKQREGHSDHFGDKSNDKQEVEIKEKSGLSSTDIIIAVVCALGGMVVIAVILTRYCQKAESQRESSQGFTISAEMQDVRYRPANFADLEEEATHTRLQ